jgi:hypothetical protein
VERSKPEHVSRSAREALRKLASAVVPDSGKAAIDRVKARRLVARMLLLNDEFVERYGLKVLRGPFLGMDMTHIRGPLSGHLIAKLTGSYERQIQPWLINDWVSGDFDLVVDVGCAEGFYAVGLARAMPEVEVRAYDTYEPARRECARLATLNGVQDRVVIGEWCTPSTLAAVTNRRVALLSDCEGYEKVLLDPQSAPNLRHWSMLVELHDNADPTISSTIEHRFRDTHDVEIITYEPAVDATGLPELSWMTDRQARLVLDERPPRGICWAMLRPRR